jgi:hypothetical protein
MTMRQLWHSITRARRSARRHDRRLELEALEDRLALSWEGVPPATITPPASAVPATFNSEGLAAGVASIEANEEDYYSFVAPAAGYYRFVATAPESSLDTVLGVFNAQGQRLAYNDDLATRNTDSLVRVKLQAGARYYFGITNYPDSPGGGYYWGVERLASGSEGVPPATITPPASAVRVPLNTQADAIGEASIEANEVDYYSFVAPVTAAYRIMVLARASSIDTVLGIYTVQGQRLAYNDDFASGATDSRLSVKLQAGVRYYFAITHYTGTPGGGYTWGVDGPLGSHYIPADVYEENNTLAQATDLGTLTQRETLTASMGDATDWFRFTLTTAGTAAAAVTLQFQHAEGDLGLRLCNSDGTLVGVSGGVTNEERVSLDGLAAGTYYVNVVNIGWPAIQYYTLDINPGTGTPPADARRVLYLNFDGANLSRADLVRWSGGEWAFLNSDLDPEGDGIRVYPFFAGRNDREQIISRLLTLVQEDLQPFGITVRRHRTFAVENQGATTLFLGPNDLRRPHQACDIDDGNNNRTDIAFVEDEYRWDTAERAALALADVALHQAGLTFGLHPVNTSQDGQVYPDSMGLRPTLGGSRIEEWAQDTSFLDRTFAAFVDANGRPHGPGPQNSYQTLRRNFGLDGNLSAELTAPIDTSSWGVFAGTLAAREQIREAEGPGTALEAAAFPIAETPATPPASQTGEAPRGGRSGLTSIPRAGRLPACGWGWESADRLALSGALDAILKKTRDG